VTRRWDQATPDPVLDTMAQLDRQRDTPYICGSRLLPRPDVARRRVAVPDSTTSQRWA